jgi:CheY-like chemotaxis protein
MARILVRFLGLEDHSVVEAGDGLAGVAHFCAERPDLVLCDLMLPELDGFGVLERVRAAPGGKEIPLAFFTASAERDRADEALARGADAYLAKPFDLVELGRTLRRLLER